MKRVPVLAGLVLGLIAFLALLNWLSSDPNAPRFKPVKQPFPIPSYQTLFYNSLSPSPFEGGKMWITILTGTNGYHCYLYDIDRKLVLGELFHADPEFMTRDQSQLLCLARRRASHSAVAWLSNLLKGVRQLLAHGKANLSNTDTETVWALNLQRGGATRLGSLSQYPGAGSFFEPSPSFRYGYNKPTASFETSEIYICDLDRRVLLKREVEGWPEGWWNESEIIIKDATNNFLLYDVATERMTPLLRAGKVADSFRAAGLPDSPGAGNLFSVWNGKENEFYLTDIDRRWLATNSYLFKVERPVAGLKLLAADFKFGWADHFTPDGTRYLYGDRETGAYSGVFLRDLRANSDLVLAARDPSQSSSQPNLYHETVIYSRSNQLWQVDFSGSNRTRLFPPPGP